MRKIAVIGGGAAGCFCAVNLGRMAPEADITIFEAGPKLLAKVAVTGGGRCNYTNTFEAVGDLREVYPRGWQFMRRGLGRFSQEDTVRWFAAEGIRPAIQPDHCIFPETQDAMHVVRVLERELRRCGVKVLTGVRISSITETAWTEETSAPAVPPAREANNHATPPSQDAKAPGYILNGLHGPFDAVVVTSGGGATGMLDGLGLTIEKPVPSLFTLKTGAVSSQSAGQPSAAGEKKQPSSAKEQSQPTLDIRSLMGTVVENAVLRLAGTPFRSEGTLLLTDWGVSGPATLKLSSYAARHLADNQYRGTLLIGWLPVSEEEAGALLDTMSRREPKKQLSTTPPGGITSRLWKHILLRAGLRDTVTWSELGTKGRARLAARLTADEYPIAGRCHFKEEFVTCGGVALSNVKSDTLECRTHPGLYFAGEVLDIDAVTGGFNLQAAWTSGYVVAQAIAAGGR